MIIVDHRMNKIEQLKNVDFEHGVEIDLRLHFGNIVLAHDPHQPGDTFHEWIENYRHKLLVLNVKEDGLESEINSVLKSHNIENYFFLDQPFPTIRKSLNLGLNSALRVSEYEPLLLSANLIPKWIWVDSFTGDWSHLIKASELAEENDVKLCLVSPELQGRNTDDEISQIRSYLKNNGIEVHAVCTKLSRSWHD